MINHSTIKFYEPSPIAMTRPQITDLINQVKYNEDGTVSNVVLYVIRHEPGTLEQYKDNFTNLLKDIADGYIFMIQEPEKPVLPATGHFFRSILVTCPHCGDQDEYEFTDQEILLNTKQMCNHCDNFYLITNIESEYL